MAKVYWSLLRWRNYDVVQLINPIFLELKAERLFPIYRYLRRHNRKMVLGAFGIIFIILIVIPRIRGSKIRPDDHINPVRVEEDKGEDL